MKQIIVLFLAVVCITFTTFAQAPIIFQNLNAINRDVQYISSSTLVIAGDHGKIIRTDNGGKSWRWQECYQRVNFKKLHFLNTQLGYVVGDSGVVLNTSDGGEHWTAHSLPTSSLNGVYTLTSTVAVVVGMNGNIFRTNDAGSTWTNVYSDTSFNLTDVQFVDQNFGTAVGNNGTILRTLDGGLTWNLLYSEPLLNITRVQFINKQYGYAVGGAVRYADTTRLYYLFRALRTTDGGTTWTKQGDTNSARLLLSLAVIDTANVVATSYLSRIYRTINSGNVWQEDTLSLSTFVRPLNRPDYYLGGVSFLNSQKGVFVGESNVIAFTNNKGASWELNSWAWITTYQDNYRVHDITFNTDNSGVILMNAGRILQTPDGGVTSMQRIPTASEPVITKSSYWSGVHFTSPSEGKAYGINDASITVAMVAHTTDSGNTWVRTDEIALSQIMFVNNLRGYATRGSNPRVLRTDDGGTTWIPLKNYSGWSASIRSFLSEDVGFITSSQNKQLNDTTAYIIAKIYRTKDAGETFDEVFTDSTIGGFINSVVPRDNNTIFAAGDLKGQILRSDDAGLTWKWYTIPTINQIYQIYFHTKYLGFMIENDDKILLTTDGGDSWQQHDIPPFKVFEGDKSYPYFNIKRGNNDSTMYLMGRNRFVRCIIPKELRTDVEEPKLSEGTFNPYFYIQTQPIPATSSMEVKLYGLYSVKNQPLSVKVFNMLGVEVGDFSREANAGNNGSYTTFNADVSKLGGGVYVLQYSAGGYSKSGLFVVAR
ncbi:MAG: hypothetical protein JST20_13480 [Bacteroidetes bacterium]|nr:hypothetical protein [Bacteroidota bacterium]